MKLSAGTLLQGGKYRIEEHLGSGGFGCTYKAYYNTMGCYVAIKESFVKDFCNREENGTVKVATQGKTELVDKLRNKFFNEARTLFSSKMYHPNIVRVSDVFEENGTVYYVMDYIEGSTLATLIEQKGHLAEDEALRYIRQVADALKHLHANNCLHLDVKPANIMIDGSGKAVLIDFGVSKQYDEANGENTSTLLGHTPGYAPIEQSGRGLIKFNAACDIYALGATLYKALTGTTPVEATLRAGDKSLCELTYPEHVSAAIRTAIDKAMQISRGDRPQSIEEFLCLVESGKIKDESGKPDAGETVLNGNVKAASKREGENLFTHTASESSFDEVKGENGKLVADESQSIDVVEVPDSADTVISNESEKSHSADAVILNDSEKSQPANNEILRSAQNDNSANGRQNDKDGNEEVERRNEKEHSVSAVISNESEKSQKNKPGKSLWLILLLLLLVAVAGAWFLFGGTGNGDAPKRDTKKQELKEEAPTPSKGKEQEQPVALDNSFKTREFKVGKVSFKMVAVEGGKFRMGSEDGESNEKPVHDVTVSDYYIGETEVTQALWEAVMGTTIRDQAEKGTWSTDLKGIGYNYPMYYISYDDCVAFVKKLNEKMKAEGQLPAGREFRLPTEAEWEFAARGGNSSRGYRYSGSNTLSSIAWYGESWDTGSTHPVKQKQANELGLYDMSGNVWEWCYDSYSGYPTLPQTNPKVDNGPGSSRVLRGGSWGDFARYCRVASRNRISPDYRFNSFGLRLAL